MRKVSSVLLGVVSVFFFYTVGLLAFVDEPGVKKWGVVFGFGGVAVLFLLGSLAVVRFRRWKKITGIVLLCGAGVPAFIVFVFFWLYMTEEFRNMLEPGTIEFFSDYFTGGAMICGLAGLGWLLLRAEKESAESA